MCCGTCASCGHWLCGRWKAVKKLFFGLLLLMNAYVWPLWDGIDGWVTWGALLMTVWGVIGFVRAGTACGQCCGTSSVSAPATKKKRR
ncbi:hypothetical protein HYX11_04740 [Candidatus Woesearchaeota archaeon]|nr:hypothetical protein [Candidatus Woesearchaeota archaeon]